MYACFYRVLRRTILYSYLEYEPRACVLPVTLVHVQSTNNRWPTDDALRGARRGTRQSCAAATERVRPVRPCPVRMPRVHPSHARDGSGDTCGGGGFCQLAVAAPVGRRRAPGEWCRGVRPRARFTSGRAPPPTRRSVSVRVPPAPVRHDRRPMFTH